MRGGGGYWGPYRAIDNAPIFGYIAEWFNSFHTYGFTLISGYIFYYIKYEKKGYQEYFSFLTIKAKRLLVPYGFIAALWVAPIYVHYYGTDALVDNFLLGTAPSQLWFLLMLFWVFIIFWLISDLTDRNQFFGFLIVCALYIIGFAAPSLYCFDRGLHYILFFYIGFLIRKLDLCNKFLYRISSFIYVVVDISLFIIYESFDAYAGVLFNGILIVLAILLHVVGAVSAFVLLQRLVNRFFHENRLLEFFGKHSMTIYLVHQQLIYFSIGWFNGIVPPVVLVVINFVFALGVSTVFAVLMSKTKVTRFLVGSK